MSQQPLVSVVMSVFNAEKYLEEAIESILNQTYKNIEFIIVNDGSTDASLSIIKQFMTIDNRIKLVSRQNKGLPYSLNEGIDLSLGKYIARMDADDISFPDRLMEQISYMELNTEIGVCGAWAEVFGDNVHNSILKHPASHQALLPRLMFSVCFVHPTVVFRGCILKKYNLKYNVNYSNSQDYELWSRLSRYTKMGNVQKPLLMYRQSDSSITYKFSDSQSTLRYELIKKVFSSVLNELNVKNSENENILHYTVASNARLQANSIDIEMLGEYFNKIVSSNNKKCAFQKNELLYFLSKKFTVAIYFEAKRNIFSAISGVKYKFLYVGAYNYLRALCRGI